MNIIKNKNLNNNQIYLAIILTGFLLTIFTYKAFADNLIQSFNASSNVLPGMLVSLNPNDTSMVQPLSLSDINKITGVVVPVNDDPLVLSPAHITAQQVLVANSGRYSVLVDDQNGAIKTGDYLTVSSLDGIAMKANSSDKDSIGQAAGSFMPDSSTVIGKENITNSLNKQQTINIGSVPVDLKLIPNPAYEANSSNLPPYISRFVSNVTNKPVNPLRVYISLVVIIASLITTSIILFSSIYSGIGAIGRNPLAKKDILNGITKSVITALIIIFVGILAVYLILL